MKRKILSLILVAAMLASMLVFAPSTGASEAPVKIEVTNAAGVAGDTVSVDVILTATTVQTFSLGFEYDESKLENVTWTAGSGAILPIAMEDQFANCGLADFKSDAELSDNFLGFGAATAKAVDASAGVKLGTITFTIKDTATVGDAYVRFIFVDGVNMAESTAVAPYTTADKFEFVDGKVTVLADGQFMESAASDFTYTVNADGETCTVTKYNGAGGMVVIPSVIDGYTVTALASWLMPYTTANESNNTITGIVVPASVTSIGAYAFLNCSAVRKVYILGADVTVGADAFGIEMAYFTYNSRQKKYTYGATQPDRQVIADMETFEVLVTIYGIAGSGAEDYAVNTIDQYDAAPYFEALATEYSSISLDIDGVVSGLQVPAGNTALPGALVAGNKTVIAWTDGTNTYAPGASIAVDGALALEAITVTTPKTANGASIKKAATAEDLAIRFTADIAQADYAALVEAFGAANVKLGMLVTPQKYVNNAGAFTKEALTAYAGVNAYVDIAVTGYHEKDDVAGTYTLAGSLTGFSAKTILKNPDFVAVAYISVDVDGDGTVDTTVYGQYDYHTARNVLDVATLANNASTDATEKGLLATIIGWFTNGSKN